ncbi:MFS transporter [Actinotalea sp. AC32]|nr:MFS transporter [Actinotalea sp. AC32]
MLAVTETVGYGALLYCFAVVLVPMREDLGATTAQASGALSLSLGVAGLAAPLVGRWVDRHGARALMTTGSLLAGAGVLAWSRATTLPELYAAFVVVGLAGAAVLYEPAFAVVTTWFREGRRRALLVVTVVAGFSSTVFLPLTQALVERSGWRGALVVLAVLVGACAVPHALVLRRAPADLGLEPDGTAVGPACDGGARPREATPSPADGPAAPAARATPHTPLTPPGGARAGRPRSVRHLTAAAVLQAVATTTVTVHLVAHLQDSGVAPDHAALAAGALGVMSVAGRLAFAGGARVGPARAAAALLAGQALGVVALLTVPGTAGLVAFVVLAGAGFGVMTIARAALLGSYVPLARYASTSGRQALATTVGRVAAPVAGGAAITAVGSGPTFVAVAACSAAAAVALLAAERAA